MKMPLYSEEEVINADKSYRELYPDVLVPELTDIRKKLMINLLGTQPMKAMFVLDCFYKSIKYDGAVCEFGVAQGRTSALLANAIKESNIDKSLWLYDSFEGLPKPTKEDVLINDVLKLGSIDKYEGSMKCPQEQVINELLNVGFSNYRIIPGFVENVKKFPDRICFAYLDVDLYESTLYILNTIHYRMSNGGIIVIDDYNWFTTGVFNAVREFTKDYHYILEPRNFQISLTKVGD